MNKTALVYVDGLGGIALIECHEDVEEDIRESSVADFFSENGLSLHRRSLRRVTFNEVPRDGYIEHVVAGCESVSSATIAL